MHRRMMHIAESLTADEARVVMTFLEDVRAAVDMVDPHED